MERNLLYRIIMIAGILVVALLSLVPTLYYDYADNETKLPQWWTTGALSNLLPQKNLVLGLDLQGGMDLVVSVDVNQAVINELQRNSEDIKEHFTKEQVLYNRIVLNPAMKRIEFEYPDADEMRKGEDRIKRYWQDLVVSEGRDTISPFIRSGRPRKNRFSGGPSTR